MNYTVTTHSVMWEVIIPTDVKITPELAQELKTYFGADGQHQTVGRVRKDGKRTNIVRITSTSYPEAR